MKKDFIEYIKEEFNYSIKEINDFELSLSKKLQKSIRINTNKIQIRDFLLLVKDNDWEITNTSLWKNIFYISHSDKVALWHSLEHTAWYFYVQELAASSAPFYLSDDKVSDEKYLILDMSASPWGKTTQLTEYYPNSLIVWNELDKRRMIWFYSNLDRMSSLNTVVTNYDWRFFKNIPELFDKIVLDAPCSGEWTSYKTSEALKYWNIKSIKKISKLQYWLFEAAIKSLKPWWEMTYSTCTMNKVENEWVVNKILKKYWEYLEIIPIWDKKEYPYSRNWPHLDETWWFFVAKLKKTSTIPHENDIKLLKQNIEKLSWTEYKMISWFFEDTFWYSLDPYYLYKYNNSIHLWNKNLNDIWDKLFLFKIWINLWEIKNNSFNPSFHSWIFKEFEKSIIHVDKEEIDHLLRWKEIEKKLKDWYYQIIQGKILCWIWKLKNNKLKSLINTNLMRK